MNEYHIYIAPFSCETRSKALDIVFTHWWSTLKVCTVYKNHNSGISINLVFIALLLEEFHSEGNYVSIWQENTLVIEVSAENKRYYLGKDGVMERSGACLLDTSSFPLRKCVSSGTICQCVRPSCPYGWS